MIKSEKKEIYHYIAEYCPGISNGKNRFHVKTNDDLTLVLYGIEQRFYTTPVGDEKRIANSVIKISWYPKLDHQSIEPTQLLYDNIQ